MEGALIQSLLFLQEKPPQKGKSQSFAKVPLTFIRKCMTKLGQKLLISLVFVTTQYLLGDSKYVWFSQFWNIKDQKGPKKDLK